MWPGTMLISVAAHVERGALAEKRQRRHRKSKTARKLGPNASGGNAMWQQVYDPFGNPVLSTIAAAIPVVTLLVLIATGAVTADRRLQLLLIAFAFGAFFEGASGFGTPVAVTAAILIGLGFSPLAASGLSLIANTAPVAYGALGTPIAGLASVTGLDP